MTSLRRSIAAISCSATLLVNLPCQTPGQSPSDFYKPGDSISRELKNNETLAHQITLTSGQFAHFFIQQHDRDLAATLFGPDGKQLAISDGTWDLLEPISIIATVPGTYRLDVGIRTTRRTRTSTGTTSG
jgi:hypothetical protein